MLKKLAKYGNSTTLVIDKAILELLDMNESSIVKLRTDGKSLIITPVDHSQDNKKVTYDNLEALVEAKKTFESILVDRTVEATMTEKAQEEFAAVFKKHHRSFMKFNAEIAPTAEYQEALAQIVAHIDPSGESSEFLQAVRTLMVKFCPELKSLHQDIEAITAKYNVRSR